MRRNLMANNKNKVKFEYHKNDYFYDVESLENVFTVAFYNPLRELAVLCYIDDDNIIKGEKEKKYIEKRIYQNNKNFRGEVVWQDLKDKKSLYNFVKLMGIADNDTYLNSSERDGTYPYELFPVKMTDPDYDPDVHGLMFGYNSYNYDMTIISWLLSELNEKWLCNPTEKAYETLLPSAKECRDFNDELFDDKYRSQMPSRLAAPSRYSKKKPKYNNSRRNQNRFGAGNDYNSIPWCLRKSWLLTNRYIDVAKLNEKMFKVGLKRLLGMLGYQILESDKLTNDTHINTLDEMADLIAYNFSDVFNLKYLFEHKEYQNNFKIKNQLLKDYPETIYQKSPSEYAPYTGPNAHLKIRKDRLTTDSTSAKFIEFIISPYGKLKDNETVSLLYPALPVCEQLTLERQAKARAEGLPEEEVMKIKVEQTDVLEDTKLWFESNVARIGSDAHKQFMEVYNFYKEIIGKNFNDSPQYREHYGSTRAYGNDFVNECMQKYNTNLFYFDKHGNRTTCIANCSIGGIHGAEIKLKEYEADYQAYVDQISLQEWVKDQYRTPAQPKEKPDMTEEEQLKFDNEIAIIAINGPRFITLPNGEEKLIRSFLKSGSTKAKATWKNYKEPQLFKKNSQSGKYQLDKKYTYTSVGPANHEDFTSYYPLLLTRQMAFINENRTVNGVPFDPYMAIFEKRYEQKRIAGDDSLPKHVRDAADLVQNAMKLLLNAASGAGDAKFDNNIRINNKIISMRIIGQLFAWRIGQAQALAGARVPSTNTDGLYTMDISPEENNKILFDIADSMYIGIEPETLDRFVTKDSNNRMEYRYNKWEEKHVIASAKGGTLNSWAGPYPTQNLDHSAAVDRVLAYYLAEHEDPVNQPFDRELASQIFGKIITDNLAEHKPAEVLRFFQWILASSINTHRFFCINKVNAKTGETIGNHTIQHYNRVFLTTPTNNTINIPFIATKAIVGPKQAKQRRSRDELEIQHNPVAYQMLLENGVDLDSDESLIGYEAKVQKAKGIPDGVNVDIVNEDLMLLPLDEQMALINRLDANAYLDILESTFYNAWSNIPRPKSEDSDDDEEETNEDANA